MKLFEQDFYDYKTAPVNGSDVVDLTHTGMSFYDQFIQNNKDDLDYLRNNKNLKGDVVMMSPEEYFQACSDYGFPNSHPSVDKLKYDRSLDKNTLQHLKDVLTVYKKKFPMPMLNKADNGQEGLHRMMVIGDMFGWDHKVPVLVVDWADKQRAYEEQKQQRINKIKENIRTAVKKALYYKFGNIDELKEQLQWELDKQFEFSSDIETPVEFELTSDEQTKSFIVTVGPASYDFDYEDVQFVEPEEDTVVDDDDFDVDDLDLEDTEDFLKRYFGDDWRKTHPHLKDTFNIKESLNDNNIKQMDDIILEHWAEDVPGEGCIFIHPDGRFINIYPKLDDHEDLCYWLEEQGFETVIEDASWFVEEFNYVRCRNSLHLCFVDLPQSMTKNQLYSLQDWMENKVRSDSLQVITSDGQYREYDLDNYLPEDIIKLIKRYYSSSILYEDKK